MSLKQLKPAEQPVGLVGLGLMGQGIASCLLASGLRVIGCDAQAARRKRARTHIAATLREMVTHGLLPAARAHTSERDFETVAAPGDLGACRFVIESVTEDLAIKRKVYAELEPALSKSAIIASNTSSLPITLLQSTLKHPGRLIGMHWGEPAHIMRYLEIVPGKKTRPDVVRRARALGVACGKAPTVLQRDIRGFLSNRMMYAMMREAFFLVEQGVASMEDVDTSFRNDIGWWATIAGPFRWMDLTGIPAYGAVMKGLLPELSNQKDVPKLMRRMLKRRAEGVTNLKGFYPYNRTTARRWSRVWFDFSYELRKLIDKFGKTVDL